MSGPDRPTREQAAHPGSRMVGESYKDHSARAFGMLRAAEVDLLEARAEVRALRAEQALGRATAEAWAAIHPDSRASVSRFQPRLAEALDQLVTYVEER